MMANFNGQIVEDAKVNIENNRAFKYGDALFDTLKYTNNQLQFLEEHYFRLMASMRVLRMEIPMNFTLEFYEQEILKTIDFSLNSNQYRIRVTIYREDGGFYLPTSNKINYLIESYLLNNNQYAEYEIDIYKDFTLSTSYLSTIKTTNRIQNVLASIFADENKLQNSLLINDQKNIVEAINGNIFIVIDQQILTPPLSEGCINGIYRRKLIERILSVKTFELLEKSFIYTDLLNASEVFITNSIIGIQSVTKFRKKRYQAEITANLKNLMEQNLV